MSGYILHNCRRLQPGESDLGVYGNEKGIFLSGYDTTQESKCGYIQIPHNQLGWFINALTAIKDDRDYDPDSLEFHYPDPPDPLESSIPFD